MENKTNTLKRIASIHEAAHAATYHLYGYNLDYIEAFDNGDGYTRCVSYTPTSIGLSESEIKHLYKRIEAYAIICLSGYCAELKYTNKRLRGIMKITGTSRDANDVDSVRDEMEKANQLIGCNKYDDLFFYLVQSLTRKLIAKKNIWTGIIALSDEFMNSEINLIEGEKAHQILGKYIKHGIYNTGFLKIPAWDDEKPDHKLAYLEITPLSVGPLEPFHRIPKESNPTLKANFL